MREQSELLNGAGLILRNLRRTNMFGSAPRRWIQEGILVREIVEAALRNDFENGQSVMTENTNRQFSARNKLFYQ